MSRTDRLGDAGLFASLLLPNRWRSGGSDMEYAELSERLRQALGGGGAAALRTELEPQFPQYARLRQALAHYRQTPSSPETEESLPSTGAGDGAAPRIWR